MAVRETARDNVDSTHLAQNTDEGWAPVDMVIHLWASEKARSAVICATTTMSERMCNVLLTV